MPGAIRQKFVRQPDLPELDTILTLLTTSQAAKSLGISTRRVRKLIEEDRLAAIRPGGNGTGNPILIDERAIEAVRERKPGNPNKIRGKRK